MLTTNDIGGKLPFFGGKIGIASLQLITQMLKQADAKQAAIDLEIAHAKAKKYKQPSAFDRARSCRK